MSNYRTLLNTFAHINRFPVPHHFLDVPDYVFSTFVYFEYDFIINNNNNWGRTNCIVDRSRS
jgi:hypothetical protein